MGYIASSSERTTYSSALYSRVHSVSRWPLITLRIRSGIASIKAGNGRTSGRNTSRAQMEMMNRVYERGVEGAEEYLCLGTMEQGLGECVG